MPVSLARTPILSDDLSSESVAFNAIEVAFGTGSAYREGRKIVIKMSALKKGADFIGRLGTARIQVV